MEQLLTNIDSIVLGFVQGSFGSVSGTIHMLWTMMFVVFLGFYGYKVMASGQFLASDLVSHSLKIIVILIMATEWGAFFQFVYRIVTETPSDMAVQIMQAASDSLGAHSQASDTPTANAALSSFFDRGMGVVDKILEGADWNDVGLFIYAGTVWAATIGLTGYAAYLILFAKIGMAVFLALGPYFILMLIFTNSKPLFDGWLKNLLNFSFTLLFVYILLALLLAILEAPLHSLETQTGPYDSILTLTGVFTLTAFVSILLLVQVRSITSAVVGGVSLSLLGTDAKVFGKVKAPADAAYNWGKAKGAQGVAWAWDKGKGYTAGKYEQGRQKLAEILKRRREVL